MDNLSALIASGNFKINGKELSSDKSKADVVDISIRDAVLNYPDGKIEYYSLSDKGELYLSSEKLPDGTRRDWWDNGNLKCEDAPGGAKLEWYKNGNQKAEYFDFECVRKWNVSGTKIYENLQGEAIREWYDNGNLKREDVSGGAECEWYANGQKKKEKLPDGIYREWYESGQPKEERLFGEIQKSWYENGEKMFEREADGTSRSWYENGEKYSEKLPNGTSRRWFENGQLAEEMCCSDDGRLISRGKYNVDGTVTYLVHYDKDGKDDTNLYLAKRKIAAKHIEKGEKKGKVLPKLNRISKVWQMRKTLKELEGK